MSWGAWVIIGWLVFCAWLSTAMAIKTVAHKSAGAAMLWAVFFMWLMPMIYILENIEESRK